MKPKLDMVKTIMPYKYKSVILYHNLTKALWKTSEILFIYYFTSRVTIYIKKYTVALILGNLAKH
jgi:hypothetical protein